MKEVFTSDVDELASSEPADSRPGRKILDKDLVKVPFLFPYPMLQCECMKHCKDRARRCKQSSSSTTRRFSLHTKNFLKFMTVVSK